MVTVSSAQKLVYLLVTVCLVVVRVQTTIPPNCSCSTINANCISCLDYYHRVYNETSKDGECAVGFLENEPQMDYCCPTGCYTCSSTGCAECYTNAVIQLNGTVRTCVCAESYEIVNDSCQCMAFSNPTGYYYNDFTYSCHKCPPGCLCDSTGCYYCNDSTNRQVKQRYDLFTCDCNDLLVEWADFSCMPKTNCKVIQTQYLTLESCDRESLRQYDPDTVRYECIPPYTEVNGICKCVDNFKYITLGNLTHCVCKSKDEPTLYYEHADICYKCPVGCTCNQYGCMSCLDNSHVAVMNANCSCIFPWVMIDAQCVCLSPYQQQEGKCVCLSKSDPTKYYIQPSDGKDICKACPQECTCNASGCVSCNADGLRQISEINGLKVCRCVANTKKIDQKCSCEHSYTAVNGVCVCKALAQLYLNPNNSKCQACPPYCTCNAAGCFNCTDGMRTSVKVNSSYTACPCGTGFEPSTLTPGLCKCSLGKTLNFSMNGRPICSCLTNQQVNSTTGYCQCKSIRNNTGYYVDYLRGGVCSLCPQGCVCNSLGCGLCTTNSLRIVARVQTVSFQYYSCECHQTAVAIDGICTICDMNSFYHSGECIDCSECQSCNSKGCATCGAGQVVVNGRCKCTGANMTNVKGVCICPSAYFLKSSTSACDPCPSYCLTCKETSKGIPACESCDLTMNRLNSPQTKCPCQQGYIQTVQNPARCCPELCKTCDNNNKCLTCVEDSHRTLVQGNCTCKNNMVETTGNTIMCGCISGTFYYFDFCRPCPQRCKTCTFRAATQDVICLTCNSDSNRNMTPGADCPCLDGFQEASPTQKYCYPKYCANVEAVCTKCLASTLRIPTNNGSICGCPIGTYHDEGSQSCTQCEMQGCLSCENRLSCMLCDEASGYYMSGDNCLLLGSGQDLIVSQTTESLKLALNVKIDAGKEIYQVALEYRDYQKSREPDSQISAPHTLTIKRFAYTKGSLIIVAQNPSQPAQNLLLSVTYLVRNSSSNGTAVSKVGSSDSANTTNSSESVKVENIRTASFKQARMFGSDALHSSHVSQLWGKIIALLFVSMCLWIYTKGLRSNCAMFFLQSIAMSCLAMPDPELVMVPTIYSFRYIWYHFQTNHWEEFNYLEKSGGGFRLFTVDANLIKGVWINLAMACGSVLLVMIGKVTYYIFKRLVAEDDEERGHQFDMFQKFLYRVLQFTFKTAMYPVLFFAFYTLFNLNAQYTNGGEFYRYMSIGLAGGSVLGYILKTYWQFKHENITRLHKLENISELCWSLIGGIVLALGVDTDWYLMITLVVFLKRVCSYMIRRLVIVQREKNSVVQVIPCVFEVTAFLVCLTFNWQAVMILSGLACLGENVFGYLLINEYEKHGSESRPSRKQSSTIQDVSTPTMVFVG